jgi:hypothetical protein
MKRQANPNQLNLCFAQAVEPVAPWMVTRRLIFIRCLAHWDKPKTDQHRHNHAQWLRSRLFDLGGLAAAW